MLNIIRNKMTDATPTEIEPISIEGAPVTPTPVERPTVSTVRAFFAAELPEHSLTATKSGKFMFTTPDGYEIEMDADQVETMYNAVNKWADKQIKTAMKAFE